MTPALVRGRSPGAVLAAVGVLLALPTIFWPVMVTTYVSPDASDDTVPSLAQGLWSWGKVAELSQPLQGTPFELSNVFGLVFLVLSLVVGAGGGAAWAFVARGPGRSLGGAGVTFVTAVQLTLLAQWWGQRQIAVYGDSASVEVSLQVAGWLQLASVVALLVALGCMLRRPLRACLAPTLRRLNGQRPDTTVVLERAPDRGLVQHPTGSARLRHADDGDERSRPVQGPTVGFSEASPDHGQPHRGSGRQG